MNLLLYNFYGNIFAVRVIWMLKIIWLLRINIKRGCKYRKIYNQSWYINNLRSFDIIASFLLVTIRIPNTNTFFVQATAVCLSTCIKLCARLCICIEPVALLPTEVVCQNFPREFHRHMRHELSFHFIPPY